MKETNTKNQKSKNSTEQRDSKENNGVFKTYKTLPYNPKLKEKAKKLRKAGILSEVLLWKQLKAKQLKKLDFHRQKIIGNYIVDFFCSDLSLVIEIDGISHSFKNDYDETRDAYLKNLGLNVVHIVDKEIKYNLDGVLMYLENIYNDLLSQQPNTPPLRGTPRSRR